MDKPIKDNEPEDASKIIPTITQSLIPTSNSSDVSNQNKELCDDIITFKPLTRCFEENEFNVTTNGPDNIPESFIVNGKFDLNHDGKVDTIKLILRGYSDVNSYIEVNNEKLEIYLDSSYDGEVHLIDLDKNDE